MIPTFILTNSVFGLVDKGNSVVLGNTVDYVQRMKRLLSDMSKFKEIIVEPGKEVNVLPQHEGKLDNFLKHVKSFITTDLLKHLYAEGFKPGIMYGHSKVNKPVVNSVVRSRTIPSARSSCTYKWAQSFVPLPKPFTSNNSQLRNCFIFLISAKL